MRRLPIFFVLDVSESMVGEPLAALEEGVTRIVASLRKDPHALETVYVSIIAYAGKAGVISPLIDLISYYPPRLPIGGGTALGSALNVLMGEIDAKVLRQTATQRGDWEPLIFLITDGRPTDRPERAISLWQDHYASRASIVAITLGHHADMALLKRLTPNVLAYEGSSEADFRRFVDWITASVKTQSQRIERGASGITLAKIGEELATVEKGSPPSDPDTIVLTGRCQTTRRPYLIKYVRPRTLKSLQAYVGPPRFTLDGCFPVPESYFEWTAPQTQHEQVSTEMLEGVPGCPHCGNGSAFAMCGFCGRLMCAAGAGEAVCPWCSGINNFIIGDGHFDLGRGLG